MKKYIFNLIECWAGALMFTLLLPCVIVIAVPLSILTKDGVEAWGAVLMMCALIPGLIYRGLVGLPLKSE